MKYFIFIFCIAYPLLEISGRLYRTTPMKAVKSLGDDDARQVSKFASMIEFVNKVYEGDNGKSDVFRRRGPFKHQISRRLDEAISAMNDENSKAKLEKMVDTVRYHIIDNPEVLLNYKNKLKKKDSIKNLKTVNVLSVNKSFSTAESKLDDIPTQIESATVLQDDTVTSANPKMILQNDSAQHIRAQRDDYDQTDDKTTYRPSFPDEDDDEEKQNTESINLKINKKEDIKPKTDKNHKASPEITNIEKVGKKTQNSQALDKKMKAGIDKNKAVIDKTENNDPIKNDYSVTKLIYSHEKLNKDRKPPKDKHDEKINQEDDITTKNKEKDKNQRSFGKREKIPTSIERLISNIDNNIKNNRIEQHSIYAQKEGIDNSNRHYKKYHESRDKYGTNKHDKNQDRRDERHSLWIKVDGKNDDTLDGEEKWDKNHDKWSKKERELDDKFDKWIKIDEDKVNNDGSRSKKGNANDKYNDEENDWDTEKELDKSNERWIKNHKGQVNNEGNWSDREKNRNKNTDKYSNRHNDWDKNDEKPKKEKDWNKMDQYDHTEKWFDKMEYEWNKRHEIFDKNAKGAQYDTGYQSNQNERDDDYKKRDNKWTKKDDHRHKKHDRTYIDDRKISGNQYSDEQTYEGMRHDRYKIVERNSRDRSRDDDSRPLG